jgi:ABC-2 type transport system ATP-binding protein
MSDPVIQTRSLGKTYQSFWSARKVKALHELNLDVKPGTIFGFLGPNGAGKTTTIKLLLGLITPTRGTGTIFGIPIGDKRSRERIGFLPDEPSFAGHLRALEFLELCAELAHVPVRERHRRGEELLVRVGLEGQGDSKLTTFSRGMLQRIGIAQAVIHQPDLVLLDEPLNGLDPYGRKDFKEFMLSLKEEGKTIFFSSHILSDVQEMCDEIGILNKGRMICCGAVSDLLGMSRLEVRATDVPPGVLAEIEPLCTDFTKHGHHWVFKAASRASAREIHEQLEGCGAKEVQLVTQREDLESFFFQRIEEDNAQLRDTKVRERLGTEELRRQKT